MSFRGTMARFRRVHHPAEDDLWPRAMTAGRSAATALTLVIFVAALTVDDLRLFRFSAALVGGGIAILVFAITPPIFAGRLVRRALVDAPGHELAWMESALLRRRAFLGLGVGLLVVWLVYFSSGRTWRW